MGRHHKSIVRGCGLVRSNLAVPVSACHDTPGSVIEEKLLDHVIERQLATISQSEDRCY
jgi:hypothetical protein